MCVQEANLGKVAKSCPAQIKVYFFFLNKSKLFCLFVQNTVLGLRQVSYAHHCCVYLIKKQSYCEMEDLNITFSI